MTTTLDLAETDEVQRLQTLLPDDLRYFATIAHTTAINPPLIWTQPLEKRRFEIQIDFIRWQQLDRDQRNLLLWHEAARIQGRAIARNQSDFVLLGVGLGTALLDTAMQNILLLSGSLLIAGLAGYQLYQRNRGERHLKKLTAADQAAIALAMQSGYTFANAYRSLDSALTILAKQTTHHAQRVRYAARQNVLEIFARHHNGDADTGSIDADHCARPSGFNLSADANRRPKASPARGRRFSL